jgi:hypothetical protein
MVDEACRMPTRLVPLSRMIAKANAPRIVRLELDRLFKTTRRNQRGHFRPSYSEAHGVVFKAKLHCVDSSIAETIGDQSS